MLSIFLYSIVILVSCIILIILLFSFELAKPSMVTATASTVS
jgi:hypothetical protein